MMKLFPTVGFIFILLIGLIVWIGFNVWSFWLNEVVQRFFPSTWLLLFPWADTVFGLIFLLVIIFFLDRFLKARFIGKIIDWMLYHVFITRAVWKLIRKLQTMIENLEILPRIEVEWPSTGIYTKGWLRQIRHANISDENCTTTGFIECICILTSMNNPTSGWGVRVKPDKIKFEIKNSAMDLLLHIITFSIYNPVWKYERFDLEKYLEVEFKIEEIIPSVDKKTISKKNLRLKNLYRALRKRLSQKRI